MTGGEAPEEDSGGLLGASEKGRRPDGDVKRVHAVT